MLPLDFTWTAPEACPTRAEVVAQLSQAVDVGDKELPPLRARALVLQEGGAWRLELETEMDGRRGTRLLEADSCEGLARAATLVLALTLGEGLARRQAEAEELAAEPPPPPPPPTPPPAREPAPTTAADARFWVWAAASVGTDPLGTLGPGFAAGVAFTPSLLRIGVRLSATLPRSTGPLGSAGAARSFSVGAELEACLAPALRRFQLAACATGGFTLLDASGQGTARDADASVPLYGLGPGLTASWLVHPRAFVGVGVVSRFLLTRPELVVEGSPDKRRVEGASLSAELGGGWRW